MQTILAQLTAQINPLLIWTLITTYITTLTILSIYSLHRLYLIFLYFKHKNTHHATLPAINKIIPVTIQIPLYNEHAITHQIVAAIANLNQPKHALQIQILDDSTDPASLQISKDILAQYLTQGYDISLQHRKNRIGFKAGALKEALPAAKYEFIAIFDADFIPNPDFLEKTIPHLIPDNIAFIQTRWQHINRDDSLLTQCQAIFLDSHFIIEHTARHNAGHWINFNGTAGIWRKSAIIDAGNWQGDTLTEDVDLSYRAQLKGWKSIYLPNVTCPSQIPPEINAFKSQQHRWAKGSIQCAIKLLPTIAKAKIPFTTKLEAFFHLTGPIVYPCATLLTLLLYPTLNYAINPIQSPILGFIILTLAIASATTYFFTSQALQKKPFLKTALHIPALFAIGIAIALNNARGVLEALLNIKSDFIRTPKYTQNSATKIATCRKSKNKLIPTPSIKSWMAITEIILGLYMLATVKSALTKNLTSPTTPLLILFALGYLYVGYHSLINTKQAKKTTKESAIN